MTGGTIDGAATCYQHVTAPNHNPVIGGHAAMAIGQSTLISCACGCGAMRPLQDAQYRRRRFISGHGGGRPAKHTDTVLILCACGCGQLCSRRGAQNKTRRFIAGHYRRQRGPIREGRYVVIKGRLEHVVIAERAIGRPLPDRSEVHHVDGRRHNNAHSNLVICQDHAYHMLLHKRARVLRAGGDPNVHGICCHCKRLFLIAELSSTHRNQCANCRSVRRKALYRQRKSLEIQQ